MASGSAQMSELSCPSNRTQLRAFCIGRTVAPESQELPHLRALCFGEKA